jgi:tRNA modification GTPase
MSAPETIAAIATAPGRGGVGVVRISGPATERIASGILGRTPEPRRATLGAFSDGAGRVIDRGIALYFPAPHSYTGETVLELHGHGGPVVLQLILQRCLELGARIGEPGEFTRRAFLNGKMDLAQAESVADLIDAATAGAARSAMSSLEGVFSERVEALRQGLVDLRAFLEATLDFPEEDIEMLGRSEARTRLAGTLERLDSVLASAEQGSLLREGVRIVLAGQPNMGKSSLLNRLAGEDLAIVTEVPGTTRDAIRQTISLGGVPAHIIDTAGLRDAIDPVEQAGIARTWSAIGRADVVVLVADSRTGIAEADRAICARLPSGLHRIDVMNKIDLANRPPVAEYTTGGATVWLSAKTGAGVPLLQEALMRAIGWRGESDGVFLARARHLEALRTARAHLRSAQDEGLGLELMAEELRLAQGCLGRITGEFTSDDLLGEIFGRFCIGK